jgi:transposase
MSDSIKPISDEIKLKTSNSTPIIGIDQESFVTIPKLEQKISASIPLPPPGGSGLDVLARLAEARDRATVIGIAIGAVRRFIEENTALKAENARIIEENALKTKEIKELSFELRRYEWEKRQRSQHLESGRPGWLPSDFMESCGNRAEGEENDDSKAEKETEEISRLNLIIKGLTEENRLLKLEIENLKVELGKPKADSGNSGISSALDAKKKICGGGQKKDPGDGDGSEKGRKGAKPGHTAHFRDPFNLEEADEIHNYTKEEGSLCPKCGCKLEIDKELNKQTDCYEKPPVVCEKHVHIIHGYKCPICNRKFRAEAPKMVEKGHILGLSFIVELIYQKTFCKTTIRKIASLLWDVYGIKISIGAVSKYLINVGMALRPIYLEVKDAIKNADILNSDETSYNVEGKKTYVWGVKSHDLAVFKFGTRAGCVFSSIVGDDFKGIIGCDGYTVYRSYANNHPGVDLQLCHSHLKREFQYCSDFLAKQDVKEFGDKAREIQRAFLHDWHIYKDIEDKESEEAELLKAKILGLELELINCCKNAPETENKPKNLRDRFIKYHEDYFRFLDIPGLDPTNNCLERMLRDVVVERKISYGTQSIFGCLASETFWTINETTDLKKIEFAPYYKKAIDAALKGDPLPSLVNIGGTVDPKYIEAAKIERKAIKAQLKALAKAIKEKKDGVKPFIDSPSTSKANPGKKKSAPQSPDAEAEAPASNKPFPDLMQEEAASNKSSPEVELEETASFDSSPEAKPEEATSNKASLDEEPEGSIIKKVSLGEKPKATTANKPSPDVKQEETASNKSSPEAKLEEAAANKASLGEKPKVTAATKSSTEAKPRAGKGNKPSLSEKPQGATADKSSSSVKHKEAAAKESPAEAKPEGAIRKPVASSKKANAATSKHPSPIEEASASNSHLSEIKAEAAISKPVASYKKANVASSKHPPPKEEASASKPSLSEVKAEEAITQEIASDAEPVVVVSMHSSSEEEASTAKSPPSETTAETSRHNSKIADKKQFNERNKSVSTGKLRPKTASKNDNPALSPPLKMPQKASKMAVKPINHDPAMRGSGRRIKVPGLKNSGACPNGASCRKSGKPGADGPCRGKAPKGSSL